MMKVEPLLQLLDEASDRAEKLFQRRGHFRTTLFGVDRGNGIKWEEMGCDVPPFVSDQQTLDQLAAEMRADVKDALAVAIVYAGHVYRAVDADLAAALANTVTLQPATTKTRAICFEIHSRDEHIRCWRAIVAEHTLGELSKMESAADSRYANLWEKS
jgi:hypothetical protein